MAARGFLLAAPRSGAGKTTVTLALLAALKHRGLAVSAAKCGPDYIDPAFHAAATGRAVPNLDGWAMSPALLRATADGAASGAEVLIIEAAMGLFDGIAGAPGRGGSAAELAKALGLPVVLLLDVSGQAQSAAAVALGLSRYDPDLQVAGVLLNRYGSARHRARVAEALEAQGIAVFGGLPRNEEIALPSRHLGLVQAAEHEALAPLLARLAALAEEHCDLDALLARAVPLSPLSAGHRPALAPPGQRIAIARDLAFSFLYPHLLDGWRRAGAELSFFSPLADEAPDSGADCCWLPGGYPELHAGRIASARGFLDGLRSFAARGAVHGECGGFMVLGEALEDAEGVRHPMAGLLGHSTSYAKRSLHLGYRCARLRADGPLGREGRWLRGHEFHYSTELGTHSDEPLVDLCDGEGRSLGVAGARRGRVSGSYFHVIASEE